MKLTKEEQDILESFERGEWHRVDDFERRKVEIEQMAASALAKDHTVEIPLTERDMVTLKQKAAHEGLSFQEYISSVLHKFVNGSLVSR